MEGDDANACSRRKPPGRALGCGACAAFDRREQALESIELAVDRDAKGLKRASRAVDPLPSCAGHRTADHARQVRSPLEGLLLTPAHDRPGNPARGTLLAVAVDQVRELGLGRLVDEVGSGQGAIRIQPHVERPILAEAQATLRVIDLVRAEAQVAQDQISGPAQAFQHSRGLDEAAPVCGDVDTAGGIADRFLGPQQVAGVEIAQQHASMSHGFGDGRGVAAEPGGQIRRGIGLGRRQQPQDIIKQDRRVAFGHGRAPATGSRKGLVHDGRYAALMIQRAMIAPLIAALALGSTTLGCIPRSITLQLDADDGPVRQTRVVKGTSGAEIALIDLEGVIGSVGAFGSGISTDDLAAKLDAAARDDDIEAVVLRINSPGGSVAGSETLHGLIARFRERTGRPVVVSMGEVAASGGYYIAMAADRVVAQPSTVTGSVGVIMPSINVSDGMSRIGVVSRPVLSSPNKNLASPVDPINDEHYAILQGMIDDFYGQFRSLVLEARPGIADPDRMLDGRVFTGRQALEAGLVDELGSLMDAFEAAKTLAGEPGASLVKLHRSRSRPLTPYAQAAVGGSVDAGVGGFPWPSIDRPLGAGAYYLWLPPGSLSLSGSR